MSESADRIVQIAERFQASSFSPYLRSESEIGQPSLAAQRLSFHTVFGDARSRLITPTNGVASLLIRYKQREGGVVSIDDIDDEQWRITQIQGGCQEGYRVNTGLRWVEYMGDQIRGYANDPAAGVRWITMPHTAQIAGMANAQSDDLERRYQRMVTTLGMQHSVELDMYIVDIAREQIGQLHVHAAE